MKNDEKRKKWIVLAVAIAVPVIMIAIFLIWQSLWVNEYHSAHQPYDEEDRQFSIVKPIGATYVLYSFRKEKNLKDRYHEVWYDKDLRFYIGELGSAKYIINVYGRRITDKHFDYFKGCDGYIYGKFSTGDERVL